MMVKPCRILSNRDPLLPPPFSKYENGGGKGTIFLILIRNFKMTFFLLNVMGRSYKLINGD